MDSDEFRRHGHEIVDWLADYFRDIESRAIVPAVTPGELRRALPSTAPASGEPFEAILQDFRDQIVPGITHWGHPGWFAYFPSNASPPSVLAEFLTAGLGAQCMSWATSPAATELEQVVMEWYRQLLGLPEAFTGVIQDTASTASLMAFLTARERLGEDAARMTAYWSAEAHSSIPKAARLAGIAPERCRVIPVDADFAMLPEALAAAMADDVARGLVPGVVVATLGTTSSTACDPLRAIGSAARAHGAWYHIDAAWGGSAAILPELRPLLDGVELADSFVTNPHKWMMTNFDCTAYFVRDVDALLRTFSVSPEYLRTRHDSDVVNYRDWGIPLGRRFRALKLWFVLRYYGVEGLQRMLREHLKLARDFAGWVEASPCFEMLAPVPVNTVCFRFNPGKGRERSSPEEKLEVWNKELLAEVNRGGRIFITHTRLGDRYTLRLSVGQTGTRGEHVEEAWSVLQDCRVVRQRREA